MENSNNSVKMIGALLVGAAIGGALGILFAPDKGSVTRKKIAGKTNDLTDSLKAKFEALMEEAKKEIETTQEKAGELADNIKGN
jgi:gas vesicle protein